MIAALPAPLEAGATGTPNRSASPPDGSPARLPYVYILGAGHSGSTLLAMLLGMHPRVCTVGEVKAPAVAGAGYRCSCGEPMPECGFWRAISRELEREHVSLDVAAGSTDIRRAPTAYLRYLLKPLHRRPAAERLRSVALALSPAWRGHRDAVIRLNTALARAACAVSGKGIFVDSSKSGIQLKYLLPRPDLDVKIIRLVRDGRGVALSYRTADGLSIAEGAYAWRRSNEEADAIVSHLDPARTFDVRYEQLCAEVEPTMAAVLAFIGVVPGRWEPSRTTQHVLGNDKARGNLDAVRLDERWRRSLGPEDLAAFDRTAGDLNRRLGYI